MTSPAIILRDAIATRVSAMTVDAAPRFKRVQKDPQPQFQPDDWPSAAVFIRRSTNHPDGDGNAGDIRFISDVVIAVVIERGVGRPEDLSASVDDDAEAIKDALFTDASFTSFGPSSFFESVEQIEQMRIEPQNSDAYRAIVVMLITFRVRAEYEPVVVDDYEGATVTVRPLQNPHAPTIEAHWDEPSEG